MGQPHTTAERINTQREILDSVQIDGTPISKLTDMDGVRRKLEAALTVIASMEMVESANIIINADQHATVKIQGGERIIDINVNLLNLIDSMTKAGIDCRAQKRRLHAKLNAIIGYELTKGALIEYMLNGITHQIFINGKVLLDEEFNISFPAIKNEYGEGGPHANNSQAGTQDYCFNILHTQITILAKYSER